MLVFHHIWKNRIRVRLKQTRESRESLETSENIKPGALKKKREHLGVTKRHHLFLLFSSPISMMYRLMLFLVAIIGYILFFGKRSWKLWRYLASLRKRCCFVVEYLWHCQNWLEPQPSWHVTQGQTKFNFYCRKASIEKTRGKFCD